MPITTSELIAAWNDMMSGVDSDPIDGFTVTELVDATGMGKHRIQDIIRDGIKRGTIEFIGKYDRVRVDGQRQKIPVYRIVRKING